jgi:predicted nucleic acid-binding protein
VRIPERVAKEINLPGSGLHRWLGRHPEAVISFNLPQEEDMYLYLLKEHPELGDGEAQAMSIAYYRHWTLVTDDIAARRIAESLRIRCLTAEQLFPRAQQGRFFIGNVP